MTEAAPAAIVHYHEISLKRGNRPLFLRQLHQNLLRAIGDLGPVELVQLSGRIDARSLAAPRAAAPARAARRGSRAWRTSPSRSGPGCRARRCGPRWSEAIAGRVFGSFRITARRAFKTFPMTSVELNRDLGAHVLALRPEVRVSLEHPELNVRVEVLPDEAFVYCDPQPGAGGLPVGTGGTVAALLSGGIDSPVAAWRLMRRGCRVVFVHFHSAPYLPDLSRGKARELVARLTQWQYHSRLFIVPFGEIQREVVLSVPPPFRVVVYRRLMVRIAERLARHAGALALVTGESLGQVASQTLHNLTRIDEVAAMPILRPLIGMDKLEITEQAHALGTYEISIEPDADCCTLFTPRHPATRMEAEAVAALEARLDLERLVTQGVEAAEQELFEFPAGAGPYPPRGAARRPLTEPVSE